MKNRLLLKLCIIIGFGTVLLFAAVDMLATKTEQTMSSISELHKQELRDLGKQAEDVYTSQGEAALKRWLDEVRHRENVWVGVFRSNIQAIANSEMASKYTEGVWLGRSVEWLIHLHFDYNPSMDIPFSDGQTHLLIELPQRMRPGEYHTYADIAIQFALPFLLLSLVSIVLYQHVMSPLRKLESATKQFSEGQFNVRVTPSMGDRNDELTALAATFDHMAERTSRLITNQRQLLADLSHELRTPLTRIDMALDFVEQDITPQEALARLRYESSNMRGLVEDALTLAYLDTEQPKLSSDGFDLAELINVICEDARFEFPNRSIEIESIAQAPVIKSSQRALGQALENIIRNGLHHTPPSSSLRVVLSQTAQAYTVSICDQGTGVPEHMLEDIFKPFFRVDKSRLSSESQQVGDVNKKRKGYGLGLALAQRQIEAIGGKIIAKNKLAASGDVTGLEIEIILPRLT
ncbi:histidine kinase sensor domain-containing protein [Paraglaciecola sp. 2405UD69-4]|uniref:HAMP domain-containing sensor histidine kinase n=1 Tax=Paraglaciecola sp. 2405UD69-4 TaxID=3391836 RepID=UPI0039C8E00E